jgi:DNA polymerase
VRAWRDASPAVVELWGGQWRKHPTRWEFTYELYGLEGMAIAAVQAPGNWFHFRSISFCCWNNVLFMRIPSGRMIAYHRPELRPSIDRYSKNDIQILSYEGWNTNPKNGPMGWVRMDTRGGPLTNNCVQATCRDIFAYGMLQCEAAGYPIVLHTHDELIAEVPKGYGSVEDFERCMMTLPAWAADWPVRAAGGWRGERYRKE